MPKKPEPDQRSPEEASALARDVMRRMLATTPTPHNTKPKNQAKNEITEVMINAGLTELALSCSPEQRVCEVSPSALAAVYRAMARARKPLSAPS